MPVVRITEVTTIRQLTLQPGDEIHTAVLPAELQTLVDAARIDGVRVAHLVSDDEYAVSDGGESAIVRGRRSRAH